MATHPESYPQSQTSHWYGAAACVTANPEIFHPSATEVRDYLPLAKHYCDPCPVSAQCLTEALARGSAGIWAGTTDDERTAMRRRASYQRNRK